MLKSTTLRPLSALSRARYAAPLARRRFVRQVHDISIQHVRFKKRFFTWKRVLSFAFFPAAALFWLNQWLGPLLEHVEVEVEVVEGGQDAEHQDGEEEGEGAEEEVLFDEDALFIPLTWPRPLPREVYKGSDPEWQEFVKMSQNPSAQRNMRAKLVESIRSALANDPNITRQLGKVDTTKGRYWLDTVFPDGPPIEYYRTGLEFGENYIALTQRTIDPQAHSRLKRTIFPTPVAASVLTSTQFLFGARVNRICETFGLPPLDPKVKLLEQRLAAFERAQQRANQQNGVSHQSAPTTAPTAAEATSAATMSNATSAQAKNSDYRGIAEASPEHIALGIFLATLSMKPLTMEPPRGSIIVTGLIEVMAERGRVVYDVTGAYDPKIGQYVIIGGRQRLIQLKKQGPKGGR